MHKGGGEFYTTYVQQSYQFKSNDSKPTNTFILDHYKPKVTASMIWIPDVKKLCKIGESAMLDQRLIAIETSAPY